MREEFKTQMKACQASVAAVTRDSGLTEQQIADWFEDKIDLPFNDVVKLYQACLDNRKKVRTLKDIVDASK